MQLPFVLTPEGASIARQPSKLPFTHLVRVHLRCQSEMVLLPCSGEYWVYKREHTDSPPRRRSVREHPTDNEFLPLRLSCINHLISMRSHPSEIIMKRPRQVHSVSTPAPTPHKEVSPQKGPRQYSSDQHHELVTLWKKCFDVEEDLI